MKKERKIKTNGPQTMWTKSANNCKRQYAHDKHQKAKKKKWEHMYMDINYECDVQNG